MIMRFILALFALGFLGLVAMIVIIGYRFNKMLRQTRRQMGGKHGFRYAQPEEETQQQHTHTTTENGDTIIDNRSEQQANRKIFSKNEGEYVDYKEED